MAIINSSKVEKPTVEIDGRVEFNVSRNINDNQKANGIIAKVQIYHPAFNAVATVWKNKRVTFPQQESERNDKKTYFTLVNLKPEVKDYIIWLAENGQLEDKEPVYMRKMGTRTTTLEAKDSCPDLGIESIIADENMSDKQREKGMLYKVNIVTTIANLYGYTVSRSKFGPALYGMSPMEGNGESGNTAYKVSPDAHDVIRAYLHQYVDWSKIPTVEETARNNAPAAAANFTEVDDDVVFNGAQQA
jgi:hypothetical protein